MGLTTVVIVSQIPVPPPAANEPHFPAGFTIDDVEQAVSGIVYCITDDAVLMFDRLLSARPLRSRLSRPNLAR